MDSHSVDNQGQNIHLEYVFHILETESSHTDSNPVKPVDEQRLSASSGW